MNPKKENKFKKRIKEITKRNQTVDIETLIQYKLNPYIRRWANYFRYGNVKSKFREWDAWIRRRLRMVQLVHAAMDNKFFKQLKLVSLTSVYNELYL